MRLFFYILLFASLTACENSTKNTRILADNHKSSAMTFIRENCISCHEPYTTVSQIAPSFQQINVAYNTQFKSKKEALAHWVRFVNDPVIKNVVMKDAIQHYGLMPKRAYNQDELMNIATFILEMDFETRDWEDALESALKNSKSGNENIKNNEGRKGEEWAQQTQKVLGKNLLHALEVKGVLGALEFCQTRAIPLTDSMSLALNAEIYRVSDKPRNPDNQANKYELAYIKAIKKLKIQGGLIKPEIKETEEKIVGYYPIETHEMCLKCHGNLGRDIGWDTQIKLQSLYPNDRAIGYGVDEIRGIFVVKMDKMPVE